MSNIHPEIACVLKLGSEQISIYTDKMRALVNVTIYMMKIVKQKRFPPIHIYRSCPVFALMFKHYSKIRVFNLEPHGLSGKYQYIDVQLTITNCLVLSVVLSVPQRI